MSLHNDLMSLVARQYRDAKLNAVRLAREDCAKFKKERVTHYLSEALQDYNKKVEAIRNKTFVPSPPDNNRPLPRKPNGDVDTELLFLEERVYSKMYDNENEEETID